MRRGACRESARGNWPGTASALGQVLDLRELPRAVQPGQLRHHAARVIDFDGNLHGRWRRRIASDREVAVLRLHDFARREQHAGGDGGVGALLDQDERAGQPVGRRSRRRRAASAVCRRISPMSFIASSAGSGSGSKRGHVDAAARCSVTTACTVCVVCLRKYFLPALQRARVHPADLGVQVGARCRADCPGR